MEKENILLRVRNITKSFPGVIALDNMSLQVREATVHVLMGENGAGKSTLMKILIGLYEKDSGEIFFDGKPLDTSSISKVLSQGISMIYQELNPIDSMTVAENIYCGKEPCYVKNLWVNQKKMIEDTARLFEQLDVKNIDPSRKVKELSIAQKQLVEIVKAIANESKMIIMDEPTSAITEDECQHLFRTIRRLKKEGITFIYISHKMEEIFQIADEVTVMRDGKHVGTDQIDKLSRDIIVKMMVGREITDVYPKEKVAMGPEVMAVRHLSAKDAFMDVNFSVKKGEILGFAGLMGSGRTEVAEALFGCRRIDQGDIFIHDQKVDIISSNNAIRQNIAFLTEDRRKTGCFMGLTVYDNIMTLRWKKHRGKIGIKHAECRKSCEQQIQKFSIKTTGMNQKMQDLSGGNQQKVLLARWLLCDPEILILDEPTRGIDVGSKYEIYQDMMSLVKNGKSIIMISSELPEILGMSDRILVMHEGKVSGILNRDEADQETIMKLASGITA